MLYFFLMSTVTIPKAKYIELKKKAEVYEYISRLVEGDLFGPPSTRSAAKVLNEFKKMGRYNTRFLASLKRGLARSPYFKK